MSAEQNLKKNTFEYGSNAVFIADMYEKYLEDPNSVSSSWQNYFENFNDNLDQVEKDFRGGSWADKKSKVVGVAEKKYSKDRRKIKSGRRASDKEGGKANQHVLDSIHAHMLIRAYRVRGHLIADLDPLKLATKRSHPELDPERYGFSEKDYDREIQLDGWLGHDKLTLREILDILKKTYCSKFAVQFIHIQRLEKKEKKFYQFLLKPLVLRSFCTKSSRAQKDFPQKAVKGLCLLCIMPLKQLLNAAFTRLF